MSNEVRRAPGREPHPFERFSSRPSQFERSKSGFSTCLDFGTQVPRRLIACNPWLYFGREFSNCLRIGNRSFGGSGWSRGTAQTPKLSDFRSLNSFRTLGPAKVQPQIDRQALPGRISVHGFFAELSLALSRQHYRQARFRPERINMGQNIA